MPMEIPSLSELRSLEQEEIGLIVLRWIHENPKRLSTPDDPNGPTISFGNIRQMYQTNDMSRDDKVEIERLISEGWKWLENSGVLVEDPRQSNPVFKVLSRRGVEFTDSEKILEFRISRLLPEELVHASILISSRAHLLRQDYDTAIFAAFRQVEIRVRGVCGFDNSTIGVDLMRRAFHKDTGPLSDMNTIEAERINMQHLYAGAIGSFKNPSSHRTVPYKADEAVELIILASRLLKIVDERNPTP